MLCYLSVAGHHEEGQDMQGSRCFAARYVEDSLTLDFARGSDSIEVLYERCIFLPLFDSYLSVDGHHEEGQDVE